MLTESKKFPGFYRIPLRNCDYVINRAGIIINEVSGRFRKAVKDAHGYRAVDLRVGNPKAYCRLKIHRLVAYLFVAKPERHWEKDYAMLQVNHKDGNKELCNDWNLEWMTNEENMQHARDTGLFDNEKSVLAKNVETEEIIEFKSISACARWLCMSPSRLSIHLRSVCAGMIEKDGFVFKLNDKTPWPKKISYDKDTTTLHHVADVIAENVESGKKFLCKTLVHAIAYVGLNKSTTMNHRSRFGHEVPYKGWVFYQFKPDR